MDQAVGLGSPFTNCPRERNLEMVRFDEEGLVKNWCYPENPLVKSWCYPKKKKAFIDLSKDVDGRQSPQTTLFNFLLSWGLCIQILRGEEGGPNFHQYDVEELR